jgi:hypothetical protein
LPTLTDLSLRLTRQATVSPPGSAIVKVIGAAEPQA